jgi:hypothetical protein
MFRTCWMAEAGDGALAAVLDAERSRVWGFLTAFSARLK